MRLHQFAFVALLGLCVPTALDAQSTGGQSTGGSGRTDQGGATTTTPQTGGSTGGTTSTTTTGTSGGSGWLGGTSRWIASGSVGANYGNNSDQMVGPTNVGSTDGSNGTGRRSADYAASVGYLWRNVVGGEFLASFTPNFQMQNALAPAGSEPNVNSYMANAIGSVPLGSDGQWQPYVSGGFGAITLRGLNGNSSSSSNVATAAANAVADTFNPDETRAGGNVGVGVMAFLGSVGVRGDVRYFRAMAGSNDSTTNTGTGTTTTTSTSATEFLPGLTFWRANIGVAFRW